MTVTYDQSVTDFPATPERERGPSLLGRLTAEDIRPCRTIVSAGLLHPDNLTLLRELSPAKRLLVISAGMRKPQLLRYLDAQCDRGHLDGYYAVPEHLASPDAYPFPDVVDSLARAARSAGLARRDAFLIHDCHPAAAAALAAAALFRRHTPAVRVVTDLACLRPALSGGPVRLRGAVGVTPRQSTVAIDLDGIAATPPPVAPPRADPPGRPTAPPVVREQASRRTIDYPVELVRDVWGLREEGSRDVLAPWLPERARVFAVVDAYSRQAVDDVTRSLRTRWEHREISGFGVRPVTVTAGTKSLAAARDLITRFDSAGLGPHDRILAVGGGTLLDLVGTAALVYRGATPYMRVPTTLVGFIDAGIGLKVGVDTAGGKNLFGGYHPPLACLVDTAFLDTLPDAEIRCGLAEAIKIAAVVDGELFDLIERSFTDLLDHADTLDARRILALSVAGMLRELAANPFEDTLRRLPDFGHEYGHLLESHSPLRPRHGEAVSVGMAVSTRIAVATGRLDPGEYRRLVTLLRRVGLPVHDPCCTPARLAGWLPDICAHKGGSPHLVICTSMGTGDFIDSVDELSPAVFTDVGRALAEDSR
jgi:3-dehydroquinate synthetase